MDNKCVYWGRAHAPDTPDTDVADHSRAPGHDPVAADAGGAPAAAEEEPACESTMEDSAVPLCSLGEEEPTHPFGGSGGAGDTPNPHS